jgi:hypothetical protein
MNIQSQRAKDIDAYIESHDDVKIGNWPVEIAGQKQILPYYKFPLKLLRYNVNNGRLAMERQQWEKDQGRALDLSQPDDVMVIRDILLGLDRDQTEALKKDLSQKGQMEPGVITHNGVVINGNRRMALLEVLHESEPTGRWKCLEAVRLPATISQSDLWKIEAGLQLSKGKITEYHPVNELLKIKQGIDAGLSPEEVAAAMYGRTVDEVKKALERLELIDNFLLFWGKGGTYGLIKTFGLHEYFVDIQNNIIPQWEREGLPNRQRHDQLTYAFALIRAGVLFAQRGQADKRKKKGITHWDIRDLRKIFSDAHAKDAFLEHLGKTKAEQLRSISEATVIEDFRSAQDVLSMREQRDQPIKLIERATKALESIDRESRHFREERVKQAIAKLLQLIQDIDQELADKSSVTGNK